MSSPLLMKLLQALKAHMEGGREAVLAMGASPEMADHIATLYDEFMQQASEPSTTSQLGMLRPGHREYHEEIEEIRRLAGIVNEGADDIGDLWREFSRISERLAQALTRTGVDVHGGGKAPEGMLNPLQVNDIAYSMEKVQQQLERLDQVYQWRKYMADRKARVKVT